MEPDIHPGKDGFLRLAENFSVVPVWADVLADFETPVSAYLKLVAIPLVSLESVEAGALGTVFIHRPQSSSCS